MVIRAVTFDFWDTLYYDTSTSDARRRLIAEAVEEAGHTISIERLDAAETAAWKSFKEAWANEKRTPSAAEWLDWALADLGVALPPARKTRLVAYIKQAVYQVGPVPIPGALPCVARLSEQYALGIISDAIILNGVGLRRVLARDGFLPYFTQLTFSNELGFSKPHPRAFISTLEALGVLPAEAVHIGDLPRTDVIGAQGVGMRAIRFVGGRYTHEDPEIKADAVFESYDELESLLESMSGSA